MAVFSGWRYEIGKPVKELVWRKVDDALLVGCGRLLGASGADPLSPLVTGQRVANSGRLPVAAADDGESIDGKGGPSAIPNEMLEASVKARYVPIVETDPDAGSDREAGMPPSEHVGGGFGVEKIVAAEPSDEAATDALREGR
jgi:hypothetical protein